MKQKLINVYDRVMNPILFSTITIMVAIAMVVWYVSGYVLEKNPVQYLEANPLLLRSTTVEAGEVVVFDVHRCTTKDNVEYSFTQRLTKVDNNQTFHLPSSTIFVPEAGCAQVNSVPKPIPEDAPPGIYKFVFDVLVKGERREFIDRLETEEFEVINVSN